MIKSMTGFGRQVATIPGKTLTLELKTVNSKGLDVNIRMPAWLREKEIEIRGILSSLVRGKADLFITSEVSGMDHRFAINQPLAHHYHTVLQELQREFGEENGPLLPLILQMPEILSSGQEVVNPVEWEIIRQHLEEVIHITDQFREEEGAALQKDLQNRIELILSLLLKVEPHELPRKKRVRETLLRELQQLNDAHGSVTIDANRFEQELIYYLEKMDFTEEKIRLKQHCDFFIQTMEEAVSQGKKLGFICQEIGREINTLGSKAGDATIQRLVVQMKDELEKIKEQLLNIV